MYEFACEPICQAQFHTHQTRSQTITHNCINSYMHMGLVKMHSCQHSDKILSCFSIFFFALASYLRGIISLSNPSPYIKWCFLLHLASGTRCTRCWQRHCFPQKAPSQSQRQDGKERETDPSGISWNISSFFCMPPLRRQASFWAFVWGMSLNKTSKLRRHPCLWSWAILSNRSVGWALYRFWDTRGGVCLQYERSTLLSNKITFKYGINITIQIRGPVCNISNNLLAENGRKYTYVFSYIKWLKINNSSSFNSKYLYLHVERAR